MTAQLSAPLTINCNPLEKCPFLDSVHATCRAARLTFLPDARHLLHYCCSDDHDACTVFLAKALRSSSPGGLSRDAAAFGEK